MSYKEKQNKLDLLFGIEQANVRFITFFLSRDGLIKKVLRTLKLYNIILVIALAKCPRAKIFTRVLFNLFRNVISYLNI